MTPASQRRFRWVLKLALALGLVGAFREGAIRLHPFTQEELGHGGRESLRIRDRNGALLREVVNDSGERVTWDSLDQMGERVVQATLAVEDNRFFEHGGVDARAVLRAFVQDLWERRAASGASTLTMQLARRLRPHPRTLVGKLGEALDSWRLERALDKRAILEQYLNRAPYGSGAVGVEAASERYFGKPATHLSLAEAALLAGLPKGPTGLNPLRNPEGARARQQVVLERLRQTGRATAEEVEEARREPLALAVDHLPSAMHFTDWVRALHPEGGEVQTTLDADLQREVEAMVADHVGALGPQGVTNAAVVVLDNAHCDVLAMVGSADYWDPRAGSVNGALAQRQPGSALKPFTYGLAFERGDTPASVVADVETHYGEPGGDLFIPQNYSREYSGPVLMGEALGRSLNVPAIRVAARVGVGPLLDELRALGFGSLDQPASHYGLGLTLGNGEVTLLELAQGYAALARGGRACRARPFSGASNATDEQVLSERSAWMVRDVLSDEKLRMRAFGPGNALMLEFPVAVKTGTSTNWRDNWAIGFTDRYTVGVWAGDFDGRPLEQLAGVAGAGPLFNRVMTRTALRGGQPRPEVSELPAGMVEITVCAESGLRPGPHCPEHRRVRVPADQVPQAECQVHRSLEIDVRNGLLAGPHCPRRYVATQPFEVLPSSYATWQAGRGRAPPSRYSPLCPAVGPVADAVVITWPRPGDVFVIEPGYDRRTQSVELAAEVEPAVQRVAWRVDGKVVSEAPWPYKVRWALAPGHHRLEAQAGSRRSPTLDFEVR